MGSSVVTIPQINFSKLEASNPNTDEWVKVRSEVVDAIKGFGCFEVIHDKFTPDVRDAVFNTHIKSVFSLPLETKVKNNENKELIPGYRYGNPGLDFEALLIRDCSDKRGIDEFTNRMWGENGNPDFRDSVYEFSMIQKEVNEMVRRMIFESLGMEKYFHLEAHCESLTLNHCYVPPKENQESANGLAIHTDPAAITMVCQHELKGLEVRLKDGSWIAPSLNSLTCLIGDELWAWSNGRYEPTYHRVKVSGAQDRYSTVYATTTRDGVMVRAPVELVDEEHPLLFKPYDNREYVKFRITAEGNKNKQPLKAYCGVHATQAEEVQAN